MAENLNKIWAKSPSLSERFSEILENVDLQDSALAQDQNAEIEHVTNLMRTLDSINKSMAASIDRRQKRTKAIDQLRNELIAGDLRLIGITNDTNVIRFIEAEYWIRANLVPETNDATADDINYRDLRVADISIVGRSTRNLSKGPKSYRSARVEVISACIDEGQVDFTRHNLDNRFEIYLGWIEKMRPEWNVARGFGKKAFEADEPMVKSMKNMS